MGRKKFNMDPKKVGKKNTVAQLEIWFVCCGFRNQDITWGSLSFSGDPVSDWEWLTEEYQRRHCSVPLQRRGPQQNSHRRLSRREVRKKILSTLSLTVFHSCWPISQQPYTWLIKVSNREHIVSLLLYFLLVKLTPILSQTQVIGSTFRPSSQDNDRYSKANICAWLSYSQVTWSIDSQFWNVCVWKQLKISLEWRDHPC